jgi:hypothetical protein
MPDSFSLNSSRALYLPAGGAADRLYALRNGSGFSPVMTIIFFNPELMNSSMIK